MTNSIGYCPIWGEEYPANAIREVSTRIIRVIDSPRAGGRYQITYDAFDEDIPRLSPAEKARLTTWIIDQKLQRVDNPLITRTIIDYVGRRNPLPPYNRADRLLRYIANFAETLGNYARIPSDESKEVLAWSDSTDWEEVHFLLRYLERKGWVNTGAFETNIFTGYVTVEGHSRIEEVQVNADSSQAFVAMWFDESMNDAYEEAIKPAIEDTGYTPFKINEKPDVDKIDDEIIGEIRRSRFIVADFTHGETGARGGVYYEAGFAYGLGLPVVRSCHRKIMDENELHFDVRQHHHVVWETVDELREGLKNRIRALIGERPNINQIRSQDGP